MSIFLGFLGLAFGSFLIYFREATADSFGEPDWAAKVGGMQIVIVGVGLFICLWGLATMTGSSDLLFSPITMFLPHKQPPQSL